MDKIANYYTFSLGKVSSSVYGWDYSDENIIWPNTTTLFIVEYPDVLEVVHEGYDKDLNRNYTGVYKMVPKFILNGRPAWKHSSVTLFLYYLNQAWDIAPDYGDFKSALVTTNRYEGVTVPESGWSYINGSDYIHDSKLLVKPVH